MAPLKLIILDRDGTINADSDYFVKSPEEWTPLPGALERVMQRIKPWTYVLENADYKDSLPPLNTVECKLTMRMDDYAAMKKEMLLQYGRAIITAPSAAAVTMKLQQLAAGFVYDNNGYAVWRSDHKLDALQNILDENQRAPTLVWYQFKEQLAALQRRFPHV